MVSVAVVVAVVVVVVSAVVVVVDSEVLLTEPDEHPAATMETATIDRAERAT